MHCSEWAGPTRLPPWRLFWCQPTPRSSAGRPSPSTAATPPAATTGGCNSSDFQPEDVTLMPDKTTLQMAWQDRQYFVDLHAALSAEQWEHPSLCELWRVRAVVAHVVSYEEL